MPSHARLRAPSNPLGSRCPGILALPPGHPADSSQGQGFFRQASRIDPELTEARLWLGRVNAGLVAYGWSENPALDLREGNAAALEAVQLDEKNPYAHYALAIVSTYGDDFALARRSAEKAVELSPSFALGHLVHGMASCTRATLVAPCSPGVHVETTW
jgi:hypothetical protein